LTTKILTQLIRVAAIFALVMVGLMAWSGKKALDQIEATGKSTASLTSDLDQKVKDSPNPLLALNSLIARIAVDEEVAAWKVNGDGGSPQHPGKGHYDGILTKVYKDLNTAHTLEFNANREQLKFYESLNTAAPGIIQNVHEATGNLNDSLKEMPGLIRALKKDIEDLDAVINDPEIKAALRDLEGTAAGTQEFMVKLNAIMEDIRGKIHQSTHPTKKQRALGALLESLKVLYYVYQIAK
jgi:uncharacterized protein YoxC